MASQQKHRKLIRAVQQVPARYFETVEMKAMDQPIDFKPSPHTVTLNPFAKKSIEKTLHAYVNDLPQRKFLERRITTKDLKNSDRNRRHSNVERIESVTLVRASRHDRKSRENSFVEYSLGKLKYTSMSKQKAESVLDRYGRSSLSSPYKDGLQAKRRAISRTHDVVSLKQPPQSSMNILETGKRLYKQNRLDEAIAVLTELSRNKKTAQCEYFVGLCYMNKRNYESAIKHFQDLLALEPTFKRNIYLLIGIAWKKQNRIDSSIKILTRGLDHFPDYFDCLVYRGKLYLKRNMSEDALLDFQRAAALQPEKGFPWIGKADALKGLGKVKDGIEALNQALTTEVHLIARLRRAAFFLEDGQYTKALEDVNKYLELEHSNTEALFYKGMILKKLGKLTEALMIWGQAIKEATNDIFVQKSVEEMLKTKIQQRDFYQASYIMSRLDSPMVVWRTFIEATLLLMKKKYEEGIELYNSAELSAYSKPYSTIEKQFKNQDEKVRYLFLKPLIHTYRAYGYFSLNKLQKAMNDYRLYDQFCSQAKITEPNFPKEYNCCLIQAITRFPQDSARFLQKALACYPNKSQPYLYLAMCQIQTYLVEQQPQILQKVRQNLDKAVNYLPQLSNNHVSSIYYHRAVILLYLNDFQNAVMDIDKAIEKSEDNIPKYFYLRGLIFACCSNFSQAVQDYTVCINLEGGFHKAFIQRAKCLQMQGSITEAFNDLQKYISLKPNDPLINDYAASLLFQNCAYNDCLVALSHTKISSPEDFLTKSKCYLLMGELSKSIEAMQACISLTTTETDAPSTDLQILKILSSISKTKNYLEADKQLTELIDTKGQQGEIFHITDMLVLRASIRCCLKRYQQSETDYLSSLSLREIFNRKQATEVIQIAENEEEDEIGWSRGQAYYCLSIVALCQKKFKVAYQYFVKAQTDEIFREDEWEKYKSLLKELANNTQNIPYLIAEFNKAEIDIESCNTFMTKILDPITIDLAMSKIKLPLILGYPQIQPPSMTPEFDHELLMDFKANIVQPKPQAPWITRKAQGVVFTSEVQVFENLELSVTSVSAKQREESRMSIISEESTPMIARERLRQHFKLDEDIERKLNRLLQRKND